MTEKTVAGLLMMSVWLVDPDLTQETSHLKIDTEGAVLEVLKDAVGTLRDKRPILSVEVGDSGDGPPSRDASDFAMSFGYEPFEVRNRELHHHRLLNYYEYDNILLRH